MLLWNDDKRKEMKGKVRERGLYKVVTPNCVRGKRIIYVSGERGLVSTYVRAKGP